MAWPSLTGGDNGKILPAVVLTKAGRSPHPKIRNLQSQICNANCLPAKSASFCSAYMKKPVFSGFCGRNKRVAQMLASRIPLVEDAKPSKSSVNQCKSVSKKTLWPL
jgi:hypothetical protein